MGGRRWRRRRRSVCALCAETSEAGLTQRGRKMSLSDFARDRAIDTNCLAFQSILCRYRIRCSKHDSSRHHFPFFFNSFKSLCQAAVPFPMHSQRRLQRTLPFLCPKTPTTTRNKTKTFFLIYIVMASGFFTYEARGKG